MSETATAIPSPTEVATRVRIEVERARRRNIKGLDFLIADRAAVGAMARDLIHRDGTAMTYRYRPVETEIYRTPLLIVTPPSNKGYIFDLASGQSFVEFMLQRGYDVYLLDWASPRRDEAHLGLGDYARFIEQAVASVGKASGEPDVTIAGYCMGGTLTTIYAAMNPGGPMRNMIGFATPIDFTEMKLFQRWADQRWFDLDTIVDDLGIIPPDIMMGAFDLARPANRISGQINLWTQMWNDDFVKSYRMFDRWAAETLPVPGEYFRGQIRNLMWENGLFENCFEVAGPNGNRRLDMRSITAPILNITAIHDHIVSYDAARPLMTMTGSTDREEIVSKGGHVSLVAGPAALRRLWPLIDTWLGKRST